jgi:hypothetical protein
MSGTSPCYLSGLGPGQAQDGALAVVERACGAARRVTARRCPRQARLGGIR